MTKKRALSFLVAAAVALPAAAALAFPFGYSWHDRADGNQSNGGRAGAGGIYGMGSATDFNITCAHCHTGGKGQIGATITPSPAWLKINNVDAYKPGQKYAIAITMTGEHLGLNQGTNNLNGFALTVEDQGGKVKGIFESDTVPPVTSANCQKTYPKPDPMTGTTYVYGDCHGVIFIPRDNIVTWNLSWTAPPAGAGQLTLFYGVVDGDTHGDSSLKDDVKMGTIKLVEGN